MHEIEDIIGIEAQDAVRCSAKTGAGVTEVLERLVRQVPPPKGDAADQASTIRAISSSRSSSLSIRKIMWRMPNGLAYINVGHTNLNAKTFRAMMEMPDNRKIVMIHDTIPIEGGAIYSTQPTSLRFINGRCFFNLCWILFMDCLCKPHHHPLG